MKFILYMVSYWIWPSKTEVSTLEEMAISLDRNSQTYKFEDNLLDLIEEFQARGGEIIFQSDDTDISNGMEGVGRGEWPRHSL